MFVSRQIALIRSQNDLLSIVFNILIMNQSRQRRAALSLNQLNDDFDDLNVSTFTSFSKDNTFFKNIDIIDIL